MAQDPVYSTFLYLSRWRAASNREGAPHIGLKKKDAVGLLELQTHYDFIVYLAYSMWRKLLVMVRHKSLTDPSQLWSGSTGTQPDFLLRNSYAPTSLYTYPFHGRKEIEYSVISAGIVGDLKALVKYEVLPVSVICGDEPVQFQPPSSFFMCQHDHFSSFLNAAIKNNQTDVVSWMLHHLKIEDWAVEWDQDDCFSPFAMALANNCVPIVKLLFSHGAPGCDPNWARLGSVAEFIPLHIDRLPSFAPLSSVVLRFARSC